jgi:hypothetical protein
VNHGLSGIAEPLPAAGREFSERRSVSLVRRDFPPFDCVSEGWVILSKKMKITIDERNSYFF